MTMNTFLFIVAVGAGPVDYTPGAGPKFPVAPIVPAVAKADPVPTRAAKVAAPGWHTHVDSKGREWSHSDASRGDRAAHLSPFDGSGPYWTPAETGVRIVQVPATASAPPAASYCPTCPQPSQSYYVDRPLLRLFGR